MKRRDFLATCAALAATRARAAPALKRVGFLSVREFKTGASYRQAFEARLAERGYAGPNLELRYFSAAGHVGLLDERARELVQWAPDAAFAPGNDQASALARATSRIPVVFCGVSDPLAHGYAASLAKPGGNVTGAGYDYAPLTAKRLEMVRELLPRARRVALLMRSNASQYMRDTRTMLSAVGTRLGLQLEEFDVAHDDRGLAATLAAMAARRPEIVVPYGAFNVGPAGRLVADPLGMVLDFERRNRIPIFHSEGGLIDAGCIVAMGVNALDELRRGVEILARVLRGANPASTPIEMAERYDLEVNLGAARAIGLAIPESILIRASHVVP